ncbi:WD repeat-containing protein 46 isoform X1 [Sarcophilus harrisii]|uniref:WD repeat-containing protein 46 isoform X1 n=1 Tax=Sarcophilus harrisii TaxID=9305 RepID=UPI000273B6F0|nr:WD repeat-containing protein 46 isoform X1 [Sarcophilus harrisii]
MEAAPKPCSKARIQGRGKKQPLRYWEGKADEASSLPSNLTAPDSVIATKRKREDGTQPRGSQISKRLKQTQRFKSKQNQKNLKSKHNQKHLQLKKDLSPNQKQELRLNHTLSGAQDPFPGPAPVSENAVKKFQRGSSKFVKKYPLKFVTEHKLKAAIDEEEETSVRAAQAELLLSEEPGFLEGEDGEDTATIRQADIAEAVDIASAAKHFDLNLHQFGPYRLNYSRTGRHLALCGRRGHVATFDWITKKLMCEINVMEAVRDIRFLHSETLFAVAQKRWLHIYDNQGIELHCVRRCDRVTRLEFLPFHFLLATASETGFLTYLDVSVGKIVASLTARAGRLDVMTQNPYNAIIHLGHSNGTVSLWCPAVKEPLVKILCHHGGVRSVAVDSSGMYMATSGLDHQVKIFDLRGKFQPLTSRALPQGAGHLAFSQRGLLAGGMGDVVNIWRTQGQGNFVSLDQPYLTHRLPGHVHGLQFCPFEDVLGAGHSRGFTSILVPGAGEPNFDGLESNPYRSHKQRQEWEVKALMEKIPAELIDLDPRNLGEIDVISLEQKKKEQIERLGFDPEAKAPFQPKQKKKGRSSTANLVKRKTKVKDQKQREKVKQSQQQQDQQQKKKKKLTPPISTGPPPSALDRFKR